MSKPNSEAIKLIEKVADRILKNPQAYNQDSFCGAECCIAGQIYYAKHGTYLEETPDNRETVKKVVIESLGLTKPQQDALIMKADTWCEPFRSEWVNAQNKEERAIVAHNRLLHFSRTGL